MKTFQKIALVSAIATAPFAAQAELVSMDESLMAETTGQAGVTIEMEITGSGVSIDSVKYKDQGSVALENIKIGSAKIVQTVDVDNDGSLVLGMKTDSDIAITIGNNAGSKNTASALALISTEGAANKAELVNDIALTVSLGDTTTTVVNLADTSARAALAATNAAAAAGSVAIIADTAVEIKNMSVNAFGYTDAQATARVGATATAYNTAWTNVAAGAGQTAARNALAARYGDADQNGTIEAGAETSALQNIIADGSAVQIGGLAFYGETAPNSGTYAAGNKVTMKQTIWADSTGVSIAMGEIKGELYIDSIGIGGHSIGSVTVSGINLAGLTQKIYGH